MSKIMEIAGSNDYRNLSVVNELKYKPIIKQEVKAMTKVFTLATSTTALYKQVKKSDLPNKKDIMKYLSKVTNTLNGLIENENLDKETVKACIEKLQKRTAKVVKLVGANLKPIIEKHVTSVTHEELEVLASEAKEETSAIDEKEIRQLLRDNSHIIKDMQTYSNHLPAKSDKPFIFAKVPVVAISALSSDNFKEAGFDVKPLTNYSILMDQVVIGINPKNISEDKTKPASLGDIEKYIDMLVKAVEQKQNTKYVKMDKPKPYRDSGLIYFWIVPEKNINQMRSNTGKNFSVNKWGFAFN